MTDTRESILSVSLELFAQRGFSAVSVRDICKEVHIKESSMYYHFASKQTILDELMDRFQNTANSMMRRLESALNGAVNFHGEDIHSAVEGQFYEGYLMDGFCNKVIRLLIIEQFGSGEAREIYDRWLFAQPLAFQSRVFSALMDMGIIKPGDSGFLAERYYAPIFLFAQRWLFSGQLTDERKQSFREAVSRHTRSLFEEIAEES